MTVTTEEIINLKNDVYNALKDVNHQKQRVEEVFDEFIINQTKTNLFPLRPSGTRGFSDYEIVTNQTTGVDKSPEIK